MNTNSSKNAIIVVAAILLAAFFMPWITVFVSINAWDLIFGSIGQAIDSPVRFLGAAIPLSSILIIYAAGFNKEKYPLQKSLLCSIPIITLVVFAIILISKIGSNNGNDINGDIIKAFGLGFWLTLIGSIVLAILGSKKSVQVPVNVAPPAAPPANESQETQAPMANAAPSPLAVVSAAAAPPNNDATGQGQQGDVKAQPVAPSALPPASNDLPANNFLNQPSNLLLIASGLIFIGFFMPWVEAPAAFNSLTPTINGTYLLGQANKAENAHLILVALLLLSPVCAAIIAYDCYQKTIREKRLTICIALATYVPVFILVLYLFQFKTISRELGGVIGDSGSLGTGMLLMIAGSLYYLFYIVKNVLKDNKLLNSKAVLQHSAIGGLIPAVILYILVANDALRNAGPVTVIGLLMLLPICSIVITNNIHKKSLGGVTNYSRVIVIGFFTSIAFAIGFSLLVYVLNSSRMRDITETGNFFWQLIASALQAGFIISAIAGIWITKLSAAPQITYDAEGLILATAMPARSTKESVTAGLEGFKAFIRKNKKLSIGVGSVILIGLVLWIIFKPNPEKDGKKAANMQCACVDKKNDQMIKAYNDFIKDFASQNFKRRFDARAKLAALLTGVSAQDTACRTAANDKWQELRNKFAGNANALMRFDTAMNNQVSNFHAANEAKQGELLTQVNDKILTITDPEPDTNSIKGDLIGRAIPGWTFNNVSDIKQLQVLNTTKIPNRIEYQVDMKLLAEQPGEFVHDAELLIIYTYDGSQWVMVGNTESFITYTYTAPTNSFLTINPPPNCNWSETNVGKMAWKVCGDYYSNYQSGAGLPHMNIPSSNCYMVESLESAPFEVTFTYKPIN